MSERLLETKPGFLQAEFSEEELAEIDRVLLEPMSDEELALWYDAPIIPELELPAAAHELEQ